MEDRVMGSKRRKMGDKMDAVDSRLDSGLPSAKLVDFLGVVPLELIGAMCWPTVHPHPLRA